ncbi:fibronectin type III domain-containing protein [Sedimentitalea sp. JM2-8]|uniref:Fibronectin type III domain-containing protein n=2 Tax=Sedimentitalea xiamensis TaxID=3050037 RepID=A0ABT7FIB8_9RHOB|nr:fibronectin type III domain-containing protein [Sedimentitalea xiamensis]
MAPAALYLYHPSISEADRKALIAGFLRKATDAYGTQSAGAAPGGGAGQTGVDQFAMAVVSTIFPSNAALRTASHQRLSNLNDLALWPNAADVGHDSDFPNLATSVGPGKHNHQPLLPEMVGYPHWVVESNAAKNGRLSPINNSDILARYRSSIYQMALIGAVVTGLAEGGWEALWGPQSTWDQTNNKFATLGVIEQGYTINGSKIRPVDDAPDWVRQLWDAHRPTMPEGGMPVPVAPQPPMQFAGEFSNRVAAYQEDFGLAGVNAIANSATGVDFDFTRIMNDGSPFTGSILPLSGRQISLSHDGIQWAAPVDIGVTGSLTFSCKRWLRERRRNSEGWSPWSGNWPQLNGRDLVPADLRNIFTGGTIPVGAPINAEAPKVYKYRYGQGRDNATPGFWLFDEQPSAMVPEQTKLIAGSGLWVDGIVGISYQWQVRTNAGAPTDIPGATKQEYIRTHEVLSSITATREICCVVTADDGNGNATSIATNWITMPIPSAVINDYSNDPSPIVGLRGGAAEWRQTEGVLRIYPNQADTFAGALNRIDGLIIGQEYTFQAVISARDVGVGTIDGQLGDTTTLTGANPTTENELGGQLTGTLTITGVAAAPTMYLSVRFRGMPPLGSWIDVTEVRAIPRFADAQSIPSAMSAPIVTTSGETSISVDRAAAPDDGGSAITSYDLRWQPNGGAWTTISGIGDPQSIGGLVRSTLHHVQTRAVNAVGQGAWSASGFAITADAASPSGEWRDDFATDTTAGYTQQDATKGYDGASRTMTITPTAAWGGVVSPAIALETGHSYQINVYIENTLSSGVADFSMGSMLAGNADDKGGSGAPGSAVSRFDTSKSLMSPDLLTAAA